MSRTTHTYGQTCHLSRGSSHNKSKPSNDDEVPDLNAQYFYYANYSVDDPLSAIPITSAADSRSNQYPPLPFSARDNNALEEAWLGIRNSNAQKNIVGGEVNEDRGKDQEGQVHKEDNDDQLPTALEALDARASRERRGTNSESRLREDGEGKASTRSSTPARHGEGFPSTGLSSGRARGVSKSEVLPTKQIPSSSLVIQRTQLPAQTEDIRKIKATSGSLDAPTPSSLESSTTTIAAVPVDILKPIQKAPESNSGSVASSVPLGSTGTTGRPFVKLPERTESPRPSSSQKFNQDFDITPPAASENRRHFRETTEMTVAEDHECKNSGNDDSHSDVPVGISRLYLVDLPSLLMKPIYWAHVHDTAPVIRATWFYKESMLPVEPAVANQLEIGYKELRPWSQTWQDELRSAVDVGASGEEKIAHRLWPKDDKHIPKKLQLSTDPKCAAKCFNGEASAEGSLVPSSTDQEPKIVKKKYPSSQVIFKDIRTAFILKPTLQPSAYYGRKPLQKIRRGRGVGIEVVRGFDRDAWEKLHPPKRATPPKVAAKVPVSGDTATAANADFCPACKASDKSPNVTDLCLVIHGIGQKLSERVESFNFTHACNSVRRSVNVELGTDSVKKVLRKDLGGIMVLPVNWRSNLSFEDGGPRRDDDKEDDVTADFSLKDITPDTIPAVRNLISDVMLDIPFYMSHHKEKMISAVVREANRVYRLWCQNNPGFHENGRVHVIAHSLGSPMTLEVLSRQPTEIEPLDLSKDSLNSETFDFNTVNLFCAGSPAGFFLLLQNSKLVPRRGRGKPAADLADDQDQSIVGEAGTFGCLAVDNIYNILHCNDPIAYRLNATVDPQYAASLKEAHVPSATTGFFEGIGNAMRNATPGLAPSVDVAVGQVVKPGALPRLPSQLEMEIHDFTREEIAEKKFYLLNDNCQIDWLLSSGGGPFDIAYLDMLGAHSSYWEKKEFIRLLVTEIGRQPGKRTTLPNMRAQKKTFKV